MTKITFISEKHKISFSGHSGFTDKGNDPVCASVSMLFYTLSKALQDSRELLKSSAKITINDDKALSEVSCIPKKMYETNIDYIFWTILEGIQMLAKSYPDNVQLMVV